MGLTPKFTQADIRARMDKFLAVVEKRQIQRLQMLGEMCVTHAKSIPATVGFGDVTGNLRSSIGYMVFKDGVAIHVGYQGLSAGTSAGKTLAENVSSKYPSGILLVVTAGMNYAVYVEAKGRDVLTSAENMAKQELPRMLEQLRKNINSALG